MPEIPPPVAPRTDLRTGLFWIAFGACVVFGSWRMDRLDQQGASLHTAPGLWPGIVGLLLAFLGGVLAWRAAATRPRDRLADRSRGRHRLVSRSRFALAAAMFFGYAILLVGHGLPFWIGTALFVTAFVYVFRRADRLWRGAPGSNGGDVMLARGLRRGHRPRRVVDVRGALLRAVAVASTRCSTDCLPSVIRWRRSSTRCRSASFSPSSLVGVIIGALPGLTATMGVALMTTLTIKMPPEPGAAGADLHLCGRHLRRLALGDPAQHSRARPRRRRRASTDTRSPSRDWPAARWASRRRARCSAR